MDRKLRLFALALAMSAVGFGQILSPIFFQSSAAAACGAGGTITYSTHSCTNTTNGSVGSIACTVSGVLQGETLIVGMGAAGNYNLTNLSSANDSNGTLTFINVKSGSQSGFVWVVKNAASGSHTITITSTGSWSSPALIVNGYKNASCTSPVDTGFGSASVGGPSGTKTTSSYTTNNANEVLWSQWYWQNFGEDPAFVAGSGFSQRSSVAGSSGTSKAVSMSEDAAAATAGSYTASVSVTTTCGGTCGVGVGISLQQ